MNGPEYNNRFGAGASSSVIDPFVLIFMIIAIILMFVLPRKYVVIPFLVTVFLAPFGQQIYVAGVHVFVPRILILFGWIRVIVAKLSSKTDFAEGGFTAVDKIFIVWAFVRAIATYLEFMEVGAIVNQCGFLIDVLGGFFLIRFLVRDEEDFARVVKTFACILAILSLTMLNEQFRAQNVFGFIGGRLTPFVRDGAIRSQGSFEGPIPAGTFAGTLLCLFLWLWQSKKSRILAVVGVAGCTIMVVTSASSTPLMAYGASLIAVAMWPLRKKMRIIRWGIVVLLVGLHLVMKSPVWFLINRVDFVSGSSGYHRALLIDMCVRHFWDWWLIGVQSTANWGWDMWDQANQFVSEAESGGLATLICFVLMISKSFGRVGNARKLVDGDRDKEWMLWLVGGALFSWVVAFFGISYSDQLLFAWLSLLALVSTVTATVLQIKASESVAPEVVEVGPRLGYTAPSVLSRSDTRSERNEERSLLDRTYPTR
jgi:hypothetical protein